MTDTMSVEEIVAELRDVLDTSRLHPGLAQRLVGGTLTVLYEFQTGAGQEAPHVMTVGEQTRSVRPGSVPYDEADIVIRTEPLTLHRLTSGELNGREAIVSGLLDIRKAPSVTKLLLMRGLFNQYKKAQARVSR